MPALWSPKDLAVRFAPYIEELHDVFAMHGLHYGAPEDLRELAARLEAPGALHEEVSSLVRSMVLREGGSVPRTDLLEILAIAIAGPHANAAGEELHQPVRQLLAFLHTALRRPWNEPHGEERLHPEADPRAEAARELREAAAKIEAEAQSAIQLHESEGQASASRANVIPFGRARAVFSRLAREDGAEFGAEQSGIEQNTGPIVTQQSDQPRAPHIPVPVAQEAVSSVDPPMELAPAVPVMPARLVASAPEPELQPSATTEVAPEPVASRSVQQPGSARSAQSLPEFDDEPPMPTPPRFARVLWFAGIAACVLLVGVLGFTLHAGTEAQPAAAASQQNSPSPQASTPAAPALVAASTKPDPDVPPAHVSHFDEGYVAAPYSTPLAVAGASQSAAAQTASAVQPQQPVLVTRPRDPDAIVAGDSRMRLTPVAMEEAPPLHPRIPGAVMAMNVINAPRPDYPMLAKIAHVDGPVVMHVEIARSGAVVDTDVISGHHLLRHAAEDAVRHWRYKPYEVDGKAVPVSTTITVRFRH